MVLANLRRLAPIVCVFAAGCYVQTTTLPGAVNAGQSVHVELNDSGSAALTGVLGPRALSLDGRVVARTDSAMELAVTQISRIGGNEETWHGTTVTVPRSALARTQTRRFSTVQTALLVGGIVGLIAVAVRALTNGDEAVAGRGGGGSQSGGR